jgi:hypothetical protein
MTSLYLAFRLLSGGRENLEHETDTANVFKELYDDPQSPSARRIPVPGRRLPL